MATVVQHQSAPTPLQQFYGGKVVFITGGAGFLGKLLLYKLLAACPDVKTVYLLVRQKRGQDVQSRVNTLFSNPIFDKCTQQFHKIQPIAGDCERPGLGLSADDRQTLVDNVNVVFHLAASIRFDDPLASALRINVLGTRELLQLCSEMAQLACCLHVSTAFSNCPLSRIEERIYASPIADTMKLLQLSADRQQQQADQQQLLDQLVQAVRPETLRRWPNTYTFTKAVAENVVQQSVEQYDGGLRAAIFRPGIVISARSEPVAGWTDNFMGSTGLWTGVMLGIVKTLRYRPDASTNLLPVDMCANAMLTVAWHVATTATTQSPLIGDQQKKEVPVYNYCATPDNPLSWRGFTASVKYAKHYPPKRLMGAIGFTPNTNRFVHSVYKFVLHTVPAWIVDIVASAMPLWGQKPPRLRQSYKRLHTTMDMVEYFSTRHWHYELENMRRVRGAMQPRDRELFDADLGAIDWDTYLCDYELGIRQYLLKDPMETLPAARQRLWRFQMVHVVYKYSALAAFCGFGYFAYNRVRNLI